MEEDIQAVVVAEEVVEAILVNLYNIEATNSKESQ